jgi:hypothetical protein
MSRFETIVSAGREAEQLTTAFYRFLELQGVPEDADAWVRTEIIGSQQRRCTIALWSEEASREFQTYLSRFRLPPAQLIRRFGPSRFDDL